MRLNNAFSPLALVLASALPIALGSLALAQEGAKPAVQPVKPAAAPAAAAPVVKQDDAAAAKAKQVLIDSAAAIKQMKGITAHASRQLEGVGFAFSSEGQIWFLRNGATPAVSPFMIKGTMKQPASESTLEAFFNGQIGMWRDDSKKEVLEKTISQPDQSQKVKTARLQLFPTAFFDAEPFLAEMKANQIILGEPATVAGVDCDVVRIVNVANSETKFSIAKSDKLPRRVEQISRAGDKTTAFVLELADVKPADVKPTEFRIELPEGYQKKVEEAVKPVQPQPVPQPQAQAQPPAMPKGGLEVGAAAPAWSLKQVGSENAETLAGQKGKAVVLGFWGPVFGDSKNMLSVMEQTRKGYQGQGVSFFGVACRTTGAGGAESARKMFQEANAGFPMLVEGDASAGEYKVRGFPSVTVIDGSGKVAAFFENAPTAEELKAAVDSAMTAGK
jgi:peroxiredoxin